MTLKTSKGVVMCDRLTAKNLQLRAAKRALSLVNSLSPGAFKRRHTSRIFINLNNLRAQ